MMSLMNARAVRQLCMLAIVLGATTARAQRPGVPPPPPGGAGAPITRVEKIGDQRFRIGSIVVDKLTRELSVPGKTNQVTFLEWVANTPGGMKAYESAFTIEAFAVPFNTALLLLGVDPSHSRVPTRHFDPVPPRGDELELWVEFQRRPQETKQRVRIEQFLLDKVKKTTLPPGPWVYTGSSFVQGTNRYMADLDGVLIGFVHSPSPIIENPGSGAVNRFGDIVYNESLGVPPDTPITLIVKVAGPKKGK